MKQLQAIRAILVVGSLTTAGSAGANGLEPPTSASARWAAVGNAAASSVEGPDAVLLNPAGLARTRGFELTLNAMPVANRSSAPLSAPNSSVSSGTSIAPLAELLLAYELTPGFAVAAGVNFAGGQGANYGAVDFGEFALDPEVSQLLGAVEVSLGAGLALTETLSVGAAWRISYMRGEIRSAAPLPNGMLQSFSIEGASGTSLEGFRVGVQYRSTSGRFGLGVTLRTPIDWALTGSGGVAIATSQGASPMMPVGEVSMRLVFPLQAAVGADLAVTDDLRAYAQYSFSDYSQNQSQQMEMAGQRMIAKLSWSDRHTAQVGLEYAASSSLALRGGYIFESAVVPEDRPSIYAPPSAAHTFGLGVGYVASDSLRLDAAGLYSTSAGSAAPAADAPALPGEYSQDNIVGSLSASYRF